MPDDNKGCFSWFEFLNLFAQIAMAVGTVWALFEIKNQTEILRKQLDLQDKTSDRAWAAELIQTIYKDDQASFHRPRPAAVGPGEGQLSLDSSQQSSEQTPKHLKVPSPVREQAIKAYVSIQNGKLHDRIRLPYVDLEGMDLSGQNLVNADLTDARMTATEMRGANLTSAVLQRATLTNAVLSGAKLRGANLSGASVIGANFEKSELIEVDFQGAHFCEPGHIDLANEEYVGPMINAIGADFKGARFNSKQLCFDFSGAKLAEVEGLTKGHLLYAIVDSETTLPWRKADDR